MNDFALRPAAQRDIPGLLNIWTTAFGDCEEFVQTMFQSCGLTQNAVVAECDGKAVSAMYAFDGQRFGGKAMSYLYALCTHPEYEGRGIGSALTKYAAKKAFERGAEAVLLRPADAGLAAWYQRMGFAVLCQADNVLLPLPEPTTTPVRELSVKEYLTHRQGEPVSEQLLCAQQALFTFCGGAFLEVGSAHLCVECDGYGSILIREADCGGAQLAFAASIAARHLGVRQAFLRRRVDAGSGDDCLCVLTADGSAFPDCGELFFPFTLE